MGWIWGFSQQKKDRENTYLAHLAPGSCHVPRFPR
jgi:hypothetical protein